jgi:asparagine synthase (glutamine-hydrolysing)
MPGIVVSSLNNRERLCELFENENKIEELCQPTANACFFYFPSLGYPLRTFKVANLEIILEGYIYNSGQEEFISEFVHLIEEGGGESILLDWVTKQDGEFILCVIDRNRETFFILNDTLGRLPMYFYKLDDSFIISRSIGSVLDIFNISLCKDQIAIYLTLGYALNYHTIYRDVCKLKEQSLIVFKMGTLSFYHGSFLKELFYTPFENHDTQLLLEELKSAFKNRLDQIGESSLALSGGLDSRMLAGLFPVNQSKFRTFTYHSSDLNNISDVQQAAKITEILSNSITNEVVELSAVSNADIELLWSIKRGQNFLGMAFLLPFLRVFKENSLAQLTGDGGDKTIESVFPLTKIRSRRSLIDYIVSQNQVLPIEKVADLTGWSSNYIYQLIENNVLSDEKLSYGKQYAYFILKERGMNWLFEGEDRNRCFSWSTTPFYSLNFLKLAFRIDPKRKKYGQLFTEIFDVTSSGLSGVLNPNWQVSPNDKRAVKQLYFRQKIKRCVFKFLRKNKENLLTWDLFCQKYPAFDADIVNRNESILNIQSIKEAGSFSSNSFWHLITVLKAIEENDRKKNSLEEN